MQILLVQCSYGRSNLICPFYVLSPRWKLKGKLGPWWSILGMRICLISAHLLAKFDDPTLKGHAIELTWIFRVFTVWPWWMGVGQNCLLTQPLFVEFFSIAKSWGTMAKGHTIAGVCQHLRASFLGVVICCGWMMGGALTVKTGRSN